VVGYVLVAKIGVGDRYAKFGRGGEIKVVVPVADC
jgi:hypothetical protein